MSGDDADPIILVCADSGLIGVDAASALALAINAKSSAGVVVVCDLPLSVDGMPDGALGVVVSDSDVELAEMLMDMPEVTLPAVEVEALEGLGGGRDDFETINRRGEEVMDLFRRESRDKGPVEVYRLAYQSQDRVQVEVAEAFPETVKGESWQKKPGGKKSKRGPRR